MKKYKYYLLMASVLLLFGCKDKVTSKADNPLKIDGPPVKEILFEVKNTKEEFENGMQPWVSIQNYKTDLINLIDKEEVVISEKEITIVIDYPLTTPYIFTLKSDKGFTREKLLTEIGLNYFKIYEEEEKSATEKTVPMEKREMHNRNQTNGKYGIWGHDIGDLVLADIQVFKNKDGKIILSLGIES